MSKEVQTIKLKKAAPQVIVDWSPTVDLANKINDLADEIDNKLMLLAKDFLKFNEMLESVYQMAPEKDTFFYSSPLGPAKILHALKAHLIKHGMRIDSMYVGDPTKIKDFKENVKEAVQWILKFS